MTNSKLKGSKAKREIVLILKDEGYQDARRGQQYCGAEGNLLFNAIILLSTTTHSDKTVEEIIEELKNL